MSNQIGIGDAPCGNCKTHAYGIQLDMNTQEPDGTGGFWWQTINGQQCPQCGEPFAWYHKPAPTVMTLPAAVVSAEPQP